MGTKAASNTEACYVKVDGDGTFEENVSRIKKTFTEQGWMFADLLFPMNDLPTLIFTRPKP